MTLPAGAALAATGSSRTTTATTIFHALISSLLRSLSNERLKFLKVPLL